MHADMRILKHPRSELRDLRRRLRQGGAWVSKVSSHARHEISQLIAHESDASSLHSTDDDDDEEKMEDD
jgi:hypothetical protein